MAIISRALNCTTGDVEERDLSPEEEMAQTETQRELAALYAAKEAAAAQRAADLALIAAQPDEHSQALARILGAL